MTTLNRRGFLAAAALATPALARGSTSADSAQAAAGGADVVPGADALAQDGWARLRGERVAVVTNPTGILRGFTHIVDAMAAAGVRPVAVLGPEHGFRGTAQAGASERARRDPRTRIPVYDAYGAGAAKLARMLRSARVQTVVFDIADVGARFYTYIWTMYAAMQAAAATRSAFVVLDRPNPIGGEALGPVLRPGYASGVGRKPIAQQHGMTVGELAKLFNGEFLAGRVTRLEVVPVRGWRRTDPFASTGLRWVAPSPNMPTPDTALVYPGTCLFEGTSFSEGRGTTRPFETIGAPGVSWRWAERLNAMPLPGVAFREAAFVPTFSKFQNATCGGVQLYVTDPVKFDAIRTAVAMMVSAKKLYPSRFRWRKDNWVDLLSGSDRLRRAIDRGAGVDEVVGTWQDELAQFRRVRGSYLMYR